MSQEIPHQEKSNHGSILGEVKSSKYGEGCNANTVLNNQITKGWLSA